MRRTSLAAVSALVLSLCVALPSASAATLSLAKGDSGTGVTTLQQNLITLKYLAPGNAIGYFGAKTQTALKKFQCDKDILCSGTEEDGYGVAGPKTLAAIQIALAPSQPASLSSTFLTGPATGAFEYSGWLPWWRAASSTMDVLPHLSAFNSLMPFGYTVKSDGTLNDTANMGEEPWKSFIAAAKAAHVRVIPTVMWGNGEQIHAVLSDAKKRVALENEIAALVKKNGYDGIDIDFEAKKPETINYFSTFLQGLYQRMGKKWVYCTIEARMPLDARYSPGAAIPEDATVRANDYAAMNKYCDRVEIMAYDQGTIDINLNAARSAPYAPVADPVWVAKLVNIAAQSISRNKLIVGIATYGYEYAVTPQPDGKQQYKLLWAFNPQYALDIATKLGIAPYRTSAGEAGFTYDPARLAALAPTGNDSTQIQQSASTVTTSVTQNMGSQLSGSQQFNYMTWIDAPAMKDRIDLAKQLGVRGVAFFSLGGAEDQGMWSLLK